jgi:hypothetical protein
MDETVEEDVIEEIKEQIIDEPVKQNVVNKPVIAPTNSESFTNGPSSRLQFDDTDYVKEDNGNITSLSAPKTIERLEEISNIRTEQRKAEEEDDNIKLNISDQTVELGELDIHIIDEPRLDLLPDLLIDDIEILE